MMTRYILPFIALFAVGCGSDGLAEQIGPPASGGAFGNANVRPECGAFSQACIENGFDAPLAVGAAMGLSIDYNIAGNSGPALTLVPADTDVLRADGAVIFGEAIGSSSLLILGPESEVVDFIHLWVAEPTELRMVRHNEAGEVIGTVATEGSLLNGDEILLSVEVFSETQALMGLFETTFEIDVIEPGPDGEAPIAIVEDIVFGWYRLVARSEGRARIIASAIGQSRELELEVLP